MLGDDFGVEALVWSFVPREERDKDAPEKLSRQKLG